MSDTNIVLVGLDLKYTNQVGSLVASMLDLYFLDCLSLYKFDISPNTISDVVKLKGLAGFKKDFYSVVRYGATFENTLITVDSGVALNKDCLEKLNQKGLFVFLNCATKRLILKFNNSEEQGAEKFFNLTEQEIKERRLRLNKIAEIKISTTNKSEIKCATEIVKAIKTFYGI